MRLKAPGDLQAAIDNVDFLARKLADCLNRRPRPNAQQARQAWLKRWAEADMKLRELFAEGRLLVPLAQTATEIRNLDPPAPAHDAPILPFIIRERDVWVDRLDSAVGKLKQLKNFVMQPGRVAVLDTSAFHEFDRFWVADWAKVTEADPPYASMPGLPIRLVVPLVVIEELDAQKSHPNGKVRAGAREILRHLRDLHRRGLTSPGPVTAPAKAPAAARPELADSRWQIPSPSRLAEGDRRYGRATAPLVAGAVGSLRFSLGVH